MESRQSASDPIAEISISCLIDGVSEQPIIEKEEMEKLANSKVSKVPYDAQDNRNTKIYVDGLSAYYHRLMSLGHDPLMGLIFGVSDILTGRPFKRNSRTTVFIFLIMA